MIAPLRIILPGREIHLIYFFMLLALARVTWRSPRFCPPQETLRHTKALLPNLFFLCFRRCIGLAASLLFFVSWSLLPFRIIGFHLPLLGIGIRMRIWLRIFWSRRRGRSLQSKKEFFGDSSLSWIWVTISVGIERIRRGARAITLGARISVNIIIGGILHRVIGRTRRRRGLLVLRLLEILVVLIQSYVFILLACLYRAELE